MRCKNLFRGLTAGLMSLVMLSVSCVTMEAQSTNGSITGTVTDSTGSVVPGATVTVTNIGTNETREVQTEASGLYRVTNLMPAVYTVTVVAASFKRFVQESVTVQVGTTTNLDASLQVGAATETVQVNTAPPILETESGGVGSTVEGKVVQAMPLNGRNVMNLLALVPGVVPQGYTAGAAAGNAGIHSYINGWGNYSIGGGIANESTQYIDGAPNNVLGGNPPALVITQDMVQEFKVESGAVSAEYGHFGGGVVNMSTKSGSNAFHGSIYEYFRNTVLNTNDFISNANGQPKSPWHQNQYGAIVGGPIKRDKAFFIFSWENYSLHKASGDALTVPTMAMRGEDPAYPGGAVVNHPIFDHSSKACPVANYGDPGAPTNLAPGQGYIPAACFDSAAMVMRGFYAYPNQAPNAQGNNFVDQPLTGDDATQYNVRVDYNVTSKQSIFGRYTHWKFQDIGQNDFGGRPGNSIASDFGATGDTANQIVLGDTYAFNPTTIGDIRVAYVRDHFTNYGSAYKKFDLTALGGGYPGLIPQLTAETSPIFLAPGPDGISAPWNIPVGALQIDIFEGYSLNAGLTKISGKHTVKIGGEVQLRIHSGTGNYAWDAGEATFLNFVNGDEWASFMLGEPLTNLIHTQGNSFAVEWSEGVYATDTWKATPKLTLNLGLRWEVPGGIYEKKNRDTVFLPGTADPTSGNGLPGALALAAGPLYPWRDVSPIRYGLFGPRVSFAYSLRPTLVLRGGYGLSYIPPDMPIGLMAFNSPVNSANTTCVGTFWADPYACRPGGQIIQPLARTSLYPSSSFYGQVVASPVPTNNFPYMQQWNITAAKEWPGQMMTEVSYAGSKGTKLPSSGIQTGTGGSYYSINQLPTQYYSMGYAALSADAPCAKLAGASVPVGQCLLPFPQYGGVYDTGNNSGGQDYNALYLVFSKRFGPGGAAGVINANYTYSHTVGDTDQPGFGSSNASVQNFDNMRAEKSIASFDVPNRTVISYVLDLPFGKGKPYLSGGGVSDRFVGGWQVNGITTFQSGFPYAFTYNSANAFLFTPPGSSSVSNTWGAGIPRPDILPGCNLKTSGSWHSKFLNNNFFNAACLVPPGTTSPTATQNDQQLMLFGDAPRNTDAVRSQFLANFDFAATKTTTIHESMNLVFKAEFFNLFNHPVFTNANAELGGSGYNEPSQANPPLVQGQRLIQLSLRLNF